MKSLLCILTTVATVLHLGIGCCGHLGVAGCHGHAVAEAAGCEDGCCGECDTAAEHDDHHAAASTAAGTRITACDCIGHDCAGCHCAASETRPLSLDDCVVRSSWAAIRLADDPAHAERGVSSPRRHEPVPDTGGPRRHSLLGRFLI